jgi:hypothetical protein
MVPLSYSVTFPAFAELPEVPKLNFWQPGRRLTEAVSADVYVPLELPWTRGNQVRRVENVSL